MKTALVTGSRGFLGRHFVRALEDRDYDVDGWDLDNGGDCLKLFSARVSEVYDLVVHCAALEPNRIAIDTMHEHLAANLQIDSSMFRWAMRTKQSRVLYISSSAIYPAHLQTSVREEKLREVHAEADKLPPFDDYGQLKLMGERMAGHANRAGIPVHVVRPFSGYGEDQSASFPFGAFRERAKARQDPFEVWGDPDAVRDWVHVSDVVSGSLAVVEAGDLRPINICTGVGTSMFKLAELFAKECSYQPIVKARPDMPVGVSYRVGSPASLLEHYQPRVSIEEGVWRAVHGTARDAGHS